MKLLLLVAAAAILITAAAIQARSETVPTQPAVRVLIDNYAFKAPSISVATGATVIWKNLDDDPHTVTASDGSFDSKGMAQGDTFAYRFSKPGTYQYYCKVHPMMRGTVTVKGSGS